MHLGFWAFGYDRVNEAVQGAKLYKHQGAVQGLKLYKS